QVGVALFMVGVDAGRIDVHLDPGRRRIGGIIGEAARDVVEASPQGADADVAGLEMNGGVHAGAAAVDDVFGREGGTGERQNERKTCRPEHGGNLRFFGTATYTISRPRTMRPTPDQAPRMHRPRPTERPPARTKRSTPLA